MNLTKSQTIVLIAAVMSLAIWVAGMFWTFGNMSDAAALRGQNFQTRVGSTELLSSIQDAETGQRGYILTGNLMYLEPYNAVKLQVKNELARLRSLKSIISRSEWTGAPGPSVAR